MEFLTKAAEMENAFLQAKKDYISFIKKNFNDWAQGLMKKNDIQAIVWNQYTPYFNDGDPCVFRIGDCYFVLKGYDKEDQNDAYHYENEDFVSFSGYSYSGIEEECSKEKLNDLKKVHKIFTKFLSDNEEIMEDVFEDHSTIHLQPDEDPVILEFDHD